MADATQPRGTVAITFRVNRREVTVTTHPMARLLDVLREELHLTGAKEGCGEGECGACAVLIDGALVNACLVPVLQVRGADIRTVEGLSEGDALNPLQQAFVEHGAAQCGFCTPAMLLASEALLEREPAPNEAQMRQALAGNVCRCTGYVRIFEAISAAATAAAKTTWEVRR